MFKQLKINYRGISCLRLAKGTVSMIFTAPKAQNYHNTSTEMLTWL